MLEKKRVSSQTRDNWLVDSVLLVSAVLASLSGIYFLYLPSGGYQGGLNPYYGITLLFERHTWSDLHTWAGVVMIAIILVHLPLHWGWVVNMVGRMFKGISGTGSHLNRRSQFNVLINILVGLSFLVTAISGVYLLFVQGGPRWAVGDPMILFSRTTWDLIHTWAGVIMIVAAVVHFAIHWKWVLKVTRNLLNLGRTAPVKELSSQEAIPS